MRKPIEKGHTIEIDHTEIQITDFCGSGSTCLVYNGRIVKGKHLMPDTPVTVKEFFPESDTSLFDISRENDDKLRISSITRDLSDFQERKRQFDTGMSIQKKLANSRMMELMVKPYFVGSYGDTEYLVSEIHMGESLDHVYPETLREKLNLGIRLVELFGIIHTEGYLLLDFKPENIMWIDQTKTIKLIDADSILSYEHLDNGQEDQNYLNTGVYSAPEIRRLVKVARYGISLEKKEVYYQPIMNVYSLGVYLFQLLFGHDPVSDGGEQADELLKELYNQYPEEIGEKEKAKELIQVIQNSLKRRQNRYRDAAEMMTALEAAIQKLTIENYMTRRTATKANYTYLSYNLLEKQPLYEYAGSSNGTRTLETALIGDHAIRENMLKAIICCGQMLNSQLKIHLFSKDAEEFWKTCMEKNPEITRSVQWSVDGKDGNEEKDILDAKIVSQPLANVAVYTDDSDANILEVILGHDIRYLIFLEEEDVRNQQRIRQLQKKLSRRKQLIAYLADTRNQALEETKKAVLFPIYTDKVSEGYDEKVFKSRVYGMGLAVHEYYYRGNHPRASVSEIQETFRKDVYNMESSIRAAMHMNYKLKSVNIDPKSEKAPAKFFEKILQEESGTGQVLFDELVALEHRSWTAYIILSGIRSLGNAFQVSDYAFSEKSDWRQKNSLGEVICHPCLRASKPGRNLKGFNWSVKNIPDKIIKALDPLDQMSLNLFREITKLAGKRKDGIFRAFRELRDEFLEGKNESIDTAFEQVAYSMEKVFDHETNSAKSWEADVKELKEILSAQGVLRDTYVSRLKDIEEQMKPALFVADPHDFKYSDEDIVRAIPKLLIISRNENSQKKGLMNQVTIVKPMSSNHWENLFSTIMIHPERLVLVPFREEDRDWLEKYQEWLHTCHVETKVRMSSVGQLRRYGGEDTYIFIDETGITPDQSRKVTSNPCMKDAHLFMVEGRKLVPTDQHSLITIFNVPVNLTVNETFLLHGATMDSESSPDYISGMSAPEYQSIWTLYRDLHDGRRWRAFIKELEKLENKKTIRIGTTAGAGALSFASDYLEGDLLKNTGLDHVLKKLETAKQLRKLSFPHPGEYKKITFVSENRDLMNLMTRVLSYEQGSTVTRKYEVELTFKEILFQDKSLYIEGKIGTESVRDPETNYQYDPVDLFEHVKRLLNERNEDKVLQNFQITKNEDSTTVFFRYASRGVQEILRKEGTILEALIYHECRNRNIFDDIRINVEFTWPGDYTRNELDIIGTKNSKTYFISAKMCSPAKAHAEEVKLLCGGFSIDGEAILVTSYYTTGTDEKKEADYSDRFKALERRIQDMKMHYINKDGVDTFDNGKRTIVIAKSIQDIVNS